jgi:omega-amidase
MQIACCQLDIRWEDKPANFQRVEQMVVEASLAPGTLLLLPEMFATGFTMNAMQVAEPGDGATCTFLSRLASAYRLYVLGGVALRDATAARPRNEAVLFGPDGAMAGRYAKMHPFTPGGERDHYAAGPDTLTVPLPGGATLQPAVCYDLRFPELFRRAQRQQPGPDVIAVIANWPVARDAHWMALLKARAIENQAYVAGCNRCGTDPTLAYSGRSQIIAPSGEVLADAGGDERIIRAAVDLEGLREYRRKLPFLNDLRRDLVH